MSTRLAGLEWTSDALRVVVATARRGTLAIDALHAVPLADHAAVEAVLTEVAATRPTAVLAALPAGAVAHRTLTLPFRSGRQLRDTVPLELRGQLPADPGDASVDHLVVGRTAGGSVVLAALARREDVDAVRARLADAGLTLRELTVAPVAAWHLVPGDEDAVLLVVDGRDTTLGMRVGGRPRDWHLLSTPAEACEALAAEVAATLATWSASGLPAWITGAGASDVHVRALGEALGRPAALLAPAGRLAACPEAALRSHTVPLALLDAAAAGTSLPPLLSGSGERWRRSRRLPVLATAAALLALLDVGLLRWELVRRAGHLERAAFVVAAAVLPATDIVDPRAQLEVLVGRPDDRPEAGSLLARLREVAARMPTGLRADLEELRLDDDHLRLDGRAPSYEAVDGLRRALAASPRLRDVGTEDVHASVDGAHVVFRLRARWVARGEAAS